MKKDDDVMPMAVPGEVASDKDVLWGSQVSVSTWSTDFENYFEFPFISADSANG